MRASIRYIGQLSAAVVLLPALCSQAGAPPFERAPWTVSAGLGHYGFEGDFTVENGGYLGVKAGYSHSEYWTFEADLSLLPSLAGRYDMEERPARAIDGDTWAVRVGVDALLHLRTVRRLQWDPYLSAGVGLMHYGKSLRGGSNDLQAGLGAGLFYHINDEWALRADARVLVVGHYTDFNTMVGMGVCWRWGARVLPEYRLVGPAFLDSDGDGLSDDFERQIGTDPFNPDTDGDGLTDWEEVMIYRTDPLRADTDYDGLSDGAEILVYGTDPHNPDTDGGGVSDGHEVMVDGTDPLDPRDDLQLHTLNIEFDYDKAELRPQYYDMLDIVVRVLERDPQASARIEGHADRRPRSEAEYNRKLSERRARAVLDYLVDVGGIERERLSAHGYGFDQPVAPNDTEENMQRNRRTEIYIRPGPSADEEPLAGGE